MTSTRRRLASATALFSTLATASAALTRPVVVAKSKKYQANLYGLRDPELAALLKSWGQPKFRLKQLKTFLCAPPASRSPRLALVP